MPASVDRLVVQAAQVTSMSQGHRLDGKRKLARVSFLAVTSICLQKGEFRVCLLPCMQLAGHTCQLAASGALHHACFTIQCTSLLIRNLLTGASPRAKNVRVPCLDECLQDAKAAGTPVESYKALYSLGKRVQEDQNERKKYTRRECESIVEAAHVLEAQMLGPQAATSLGSSGSSSSSTQNDSSTNSRRGASLYPILQLNSMQLSLSVWAFSQLVGVDSRVRSKHLSELVDAVATYAAGSSIMVRPADKACMHWSRLLYGIAKMGFTCRDSQAVQQLFEAGARLLPQMLYKKQPCAPQNVSNPLWAFATAEYGGSLQQLVSNVASNLGWVMKNAKPQEWSNA
eukprot:1161762-Pelagomonas_calceolata.AAC.17